jgi:hypothetical protein
MGMDLFLFIHKRAQNLEKLGISYQAIPIDPKDCIDFLDAQGRWYKYPNLS